jgi:hypothetical protein
MSAAGVEHQRGRGADRAGEKRAPGAAKLDGCSGLHYSFSRGLPVNGRMTEQESTISAMPMTRLGKALEAQKQTAREAETTNDLLKTIIEQQKLILAALDKKS